jgi:F-type H+-transporting ATPase subunit gamma
MAQKDVKSRISSVKNIQKITRAMEMVAAARLRRAEQRIESLRPYAGAIRRMTRQASQAAGNVPNVPILQEHESVETVGIMLITGDRGLAGSFNSQILRAGLRHASDHEGEGRNVKYYASGRRGASSLAFRRVDLACEWTGFSDRPSYSDARDIADTLMRAFVDEGVDRVDIYYNRYVSALQQVVTRETLLPLQEASIFGDGGSDSDEDEERDSRPRAEVDYEPEPEEILRSLVPSYVEISIFRALLESTASEHGARMTAMRNASENASEIIDDLTLEMNRERQAEITQEIMEVVAGAESLV